LDNFFFLLTIKFRQLPGGELVAREGHPARTLTTKEGLMETAASGAGTYGAGSWIIALVFTALMVAAGWKIFIKAGEPGWAALIPIYNVIVLLKIAGKPAWWIILLLIPVVNFVISILVAAGLAKNFGKGTGFVVGLVLLPFIFYLILGFGSAQYHG